MVLISQYNLVRRFSLSNLHYALILTESALAWKVTTDNGDPALPRHPMSVEHRVFIFKNLMSEVISGLVSEQIGQK